MLEPVTPSLSSFRSPKDLKSAYRDRRLGTRITRRDTTEATRQGPYDMFDRANRDESSLMRKAITHEE